MKLGRKKIIINRKLVKYIDKRSNKKWVKYY